MVYFRKVKVLSNNHFSFLAFEGQTLTLKSLPNCFLAFRKLHFTLKFKWAFKNFFKTDAAVMKSVENHLYVC